MDTKTKLTAHLMHDDIVFWTWLDVKTIGIVTPTTVYHWTIEGGATPVRVFDRNATLSGCQIISYRASSDKKWLALVGISAQNNRVVGSMQLFSTERNVSQPIEGHAAAFAELQLEEATSPTKLFAFAVRSATGAAKVQIIEIDHQQHNPPFQKKTVELVFPPEAQADFPVSMQVGPRFGVVYIVTKFGYIHIYDLESGTCLFMNRITADTIFVTAPSEATSGIVCVNKKGQVLTVTLDENTIIPYIVNQLGNTEVALKLAGRAGLPGADELCIQRFNQLFASGAFLDAVKVAANSPRVSHSPSPAFSVIHLNSPYPRASCVHLRPLSASANCRPRPASSHLFCNTLASFSKRAA